jgi:HEPN domain-containing protein
MVDVEIIREWLERADDDFEFASINLRERKPFYAQICFHFHQAAEKYLKAFVVANELEFRKIHDLPMLLKTCVARDSSFSQLGEAREYLNSFYVETRYPVHWPTALSYEEAQRALHHTEEIRLFVKSKVESTTLNRDSSKPTD